MSRMSAMTHRLAALALVALLAAGCHDGDGPEAVAPVVSQIATYTGSSGQGAVFAFRQVDDTPLVTLHTQYTGIDEEKHPPGSRFYIRYVPAGGDPYASGEVTLKGLSRINDGALKQGDVLADYPDWGRDGVYVYSLWRSGSYINLHCRLTYDTEPRTFMLMADAATMGDAVPELYLVHRLASDANSHDRAYYASFDISKLWERPGCRGVRVHVANTNLTDTRAFTFMKASE